MMKKKAPVLIPTLCRYAHFRRCVESLAKNVYANETSLFIALDYPLEPKQMEGYSKIVQYIETIQGFEEVCIIRRNVNYGASRNIKEAREFIFQQYDRVIFSEDDNEFSPNFLMYVNKGLEKFENDKTVIAINGYRHFYNIKHGDGNYFRQNVNFSAWGYGVWKDTYYGYYSKCTRFYFLSILLSPLKLRKLWKRSHYLTLQLLILCTTPNRIRITDCAISVYMLFETLTVVMPVVSKVRNLGWDGSGQSNLLFDKKLTNMHCNQEIDEEKSFDFNGTGWDFYKENNAMFMNEGYENMTFFDVMRIYFKTVLTYFCKAKR